MRLPFLLLTAIVLLNIGVACRTPTVVPADCTPVAPGLVHCPGDVPHRND